MESPEEREEDKPTESVCRGCGDVFRGTGEYCTVSCQMERFY